MSGFREPTIPRDQITLWQATLDDAVPADHPVRLLDALFASKQLRPVFADWEARYDLKRGKPPYHPRVLAALYVYGMLNRLRSSRQLELACHNRIDILWLVSGMRPDHSTIAQFVADHKSQIAALFRRVVGVGIKAGLIAMEHCAIDGTTIEADAGRGSVQTRDRIVRKCQEIDERIVALEAEFNANDRREELLVGADDSWLDDEPMHGDTRLLRARQKKTRLLRALEVIQVRQDAPRHPEKEPPNPITSITDPESRVMKDKKDGRFRPNYNAQMAVDTKANMVIAADLSDAATDGGLSVPMLRRVEAECGRLPKEASFDSGYHGARQLEALEALPVDVYLANQEMGVLNKNARAAIQVVAEGKTLSFEQLDDLPTAQHDRFHRLAFVYDGDSDRFRCPAGHHLTQARKSNRSDQFGPTSRTWYRPIAGTCATCPLAPRCCGNATKGREVSRTEFDPLIEKMQKKLASEEGAKRYALRGRTVEPRFGECKAVLGVRRFLRRGLENVRAEWQAVLIAINVGVLLRRWKDVAPVIN